LRIHGKPPNDAFALALGEIVIFGAANGEKFEFWSGVP
jgi:hypothetical protein